MPYFVKSVKPKLFTNAVFTTEFQRAVDSVANDILLDYTATTATWEHEVKFEKLTQVGPASVELLVDTDDEIYKYVDLGTSPHPIRAKNARTLAFHWAGPGSYRPKTQPRVLGSTAGGGVEGPMVFPVSVNHPGTKAREFSDTIQRKYKNIFKRKMEEAIKNGRSASGHAV
ncbi:MAG: hypothetical protein GYA36_17350 [Veillonellaceae bacterium]|nr:hypothetical protein [Veillonellaceae bacterium]